MRWGSKRPATEKLIVECLSRYYTVEVKSWMGMMDLEKPPLSEADYIYIWNWYTLSFGLVSQIKKLLPLHTKSLLRRIVKVICRC